MLLLLGAAAVTGLYLSILGNSQRHRPSLRMSGGLLLSGRGKDLLLTRFLELRYAEGFEKVCVQIPKQVPKVTPVIQL